MIMWTHESWQCVQHSLYYQHNIRGDRKHEDIMWNFVVDLDTNFDWSFFIYSHNFASSKHRDLTFYTFFLCYSLKPYMNCFFQKRWSFAVYLANNWKSTCFLKVIHKCAPIHNSMVSSSNMICKTLIWNKLCLMFLLMI